LFTVRTGDTTPITPSDITEVQIEKGNTPTAYVRPGNQISVNWEDEAGTVYGTTMTLNPDRTGTLVVDRALFTATTANSTARDHDVRTDLTNVDWSSSNLKNISNKCKGIALSEFNNGAAGFIRPSSDPTIGYWRLVPSSETTPEIVSSWLDGSVQFCLALQTPQTYQLTSEQVSGILSTLYGQNNVWANTGDVEVTYPADTKLYIDGKLAEIQATILENIGG
jgi:hypothetical protein